MRRRNTGSAKRRVQKNKRKVGRKRAAPILTADLQRRLAQRTREPDEALTTASTVPARAAFQKKRGPAQRLVPSIACSQPLVTTGGGALPLPTYCAQPAMLRRASIVAVNRATFFMKVTPPFCYDKMTVSARYPLPLVRKRHSLNLFARRSPSLSPATPISHSSSQL